MGSPCPTATTCASRRAIRLKEALCCWKIKVKRGPTGAQCRPRCNGISGEQNGPLWPVKSQMPRRVARRVQHLDRADLVFIGNQAVNWTGRMWFETQRQAELKCVHLPPCAQRMNGTQCHAL